VVPAPQGPTNLNRSSNARTAHLHDRSTEQSSTRLPKKSPMRLPCWSPPRRNRRPIAQTILMLLEASQEELLRDQAEAVRRLLKERGLRGVRLIISDACLGLAGLPRVQPSSSPRPPGSAASCTGTATSSATCPRPRFGRSRRCSSRSTRTRTSEGPADERCHHCVRHCRAPLSPNQMCERVWTLPPIA
jgi:hypothetical protein